MYAYQLPLSFPSSPPSLPLFSSLLSLTFFLLPIPYQVPHSVDHVVADWQREDELASSPQQRILRHKLEALDQLWEWLAKGKVGDGNGGDSWGWRRGYGGRRDRVRIL